jgi:GNAT superfamily N-acetyltransferase
MTILDRIIKQFNAKGIILEVYETDHRKTMTLSKIIIPKDQRNQGAGTAILNDLTAYADTIGYYIILTPSNSFGGNKTRLVKFYRRFGFIPNQGRKKDFRFSESMYRKPKNPLKEI